MNIKTLLTLLLVIVLSTSAQAAGGWILWVELSDAHHTQWSAEDGYETKALCQIAKVKEAAMTTVPKDYVIAFHCFPSDFDPRSK